MEVEVKWSITESIPVLGLTQWNSSATSVPRNMYSSDLLPADSPDSCSVMWNNAAFSLSIRRNTAYSAFTPEWHGASQRPTKNSRKFWPAPHGSAVKSLNCVTDANGKMSGIWNVSSQTIIKSFKSWFLLQCFQNLLVSEKLQQKLQRDHKMWIKVDTAVRSEPQKCRYPNNTGSARRQLPFSI